METSTLTYQCPNCGAGLIFDPAKQAFKCEFCLSEFSETELEKTDAHKKAEQVQANNEEFCEHMNEYHCANCGAEIISDENTAADFCYYCHSPILMTGRLSGEKKPTKIIPFKYDKATAKERFLAFAKKKWFVPKDFTYPEQIEKISGIYFPFWVTDADTDSQLSARCTDIDTWISGNYRYTKESIYNVYRRGDIHFEDIVNSALSEADKKMVEGILPFPPEAHEDFNMAYLTGFTAKKRDIDREQLAEAVRTRINSYSETLLKRTIKGYTTTMVTDKSAKVKKSNWDYSLMPIWILTYRNRKNRIFTYAMNGYTGKVYGELPVSPKKLTIGSVIAGILGGLLAAIIAGAVLL